MIGKRLSNSLLIAVLIISVVGTGVTTTVVASDGGDNGDTRSEATAIAPGSTEAGTVAEGDVDWYAFDADAGDRLYVELTAITTDYDQLRLSLHNPAGEKIGESSDVPNSYKLDRDRGPTAWGGDIAETSGTYYIKVEPWVDDGTTTTEYNLTVTTESLDRDPAGDQPPSAMVLDGNTTTSGTMSGQDVDTYAVELDKGETIDASIDSDNEKLANVQLVEPSTPDYLKNRYYPEYDLSGAPELNDGFSYMAAENETYYLRVYPANNSQQWFTRSADYDLSIAISVDDSKIPKDRVSDSRSSATRMATNGTKSGTLFGDDKDWYAFDVSAGQAIDIGLTATTENEENIKFSMYDPDGNPIGESPNEGIGPAYFTQRIPFGPWAGGGDIAEQSGTYYVKVRGVGGVAPTRYDLTVGAERLDRYDPNEQPSSAISIDHNASIEAVMTGSDVDTYAIELDKGDTVNATIDHEYSFDMHVQLVSPETPDTTHSRYNHEYDVSEWTRDGFTSTVNESGTYYVRVYPVENTITSFFEAGSYNLTTNVTDNDTAVDSNESSNTPDGESPPDDSETDKDESTEDESTELSPDSDDSKQTETNDETGSNESSDESNQTDGVEDDTSDDTATNTEDADHAECDEERPSDASDCEEMDASAEQSECEETNE